MLIRSARGGDVPAVAGYIAMAEGEMAHFFAGSDDPAVVATALAALVRSPSPCRYSLEVARVVEVDGRPAGFLTAFPADRQPELDRPLLDALRRRGLALEKLTFEGEPGSYYLSTLGVDPAFRGRGLGSALIADAEARARDEGFAHASLLVTRDNPARHIYEHRGYATAVEIAIAGIGYFRMIKRLA